MSIAIVLQVFAVIIALVLALYLDFFGKNADMYSSYPSRLSFIAIMIAIVLVANLAPGSENNLSGYIISYACFFLGLVYFIPFLVVVVSPNAYSFWCKLMHRNSNQEERGYFITNLAIKAFGFFFAFFLFFPPFVSIG